jgi:hypothetical protein
MWLVEAGALRILCDPLLAPTHHGGVFEVVPRRTIRAEALRADFVLVSHQHPDHFDVPSLHRLAELDPESVVITPDRLVAWAARELGFRHVRLVPPGQLVELEGVRLVTTPSSAPDEWGVLVATHEGAVWNQVDTVFSGPAAVEQTLASALAAVGAERVDLALVRWQPLLEIAAPLGHRTAFPYRDYAAILDEVAATNARAVVAASCSGAHTGPFAWMDRYVYPIDEPRFARDLRRRAPGTEVLDGRIGTTYRVRARAVTTHPDAGEALVRIDDAHDARVWSPFSTPALADPGAAGAEEPVMRARVAEWMEHELTPALAAAWPGLGADGAVRFAVEVVFPNSRDAFSIVADRAGARFTQASEHDWDACNVIAGSLLWEVIEGRRHWGDVLLGGALRAATRAYAVDGSGLRPLPLGEIFLYYALPYAAAVRRAVRWEVALALATEGRAPGSAPP